MTGGLGLLAYNNRHFLNCLIGLEVLVLIGAFTVLTAVRGASALINIALCYFVITVASASLGLGLLIAVCRRHGQDYFNSYNLRF